MMQELVQFVIGVKSACKINIEFTHTHTYTHNENLIGKSAVEFCNRVGFFGGRITVSRALERNIYHYRRSIDSRLYRKGIILSICEFEEDTK